MAENVKVGIIGAMDSEVALLKSKVEGARTHELAGLEFVEGTLEGVGVVVVKCGVGKVNAAMCAQALVSVLGCNRVINTGVAGRSTRASRSATSWSPRTPSSMTWTSRPWGMPLASTQTSTSSPSRRTLAFAAPLCRLPATSRA